MALDGIAVKVICSELNEFLTGMRIEKIYMPTKDEVVLGLRYGRDAFRLSLNVNSSMPRVHITGEKKENPASPPMFCMLLRKYLAGGKILSVDSYNYERLIDMKIESTDEMGDVSTKRLIIELLGKLSNIVVVNEKGVIIDCLKHVDSDLSALREVMPARIYEYPPQQKDKLLPEEFNVQIIKQRMAANPEAECFRMIIDAVTGFSPLLAKEICFRAGVDAHMTVGQLSDTHKLVLMAEMSKMVEQLIKVANGESVPCLYYSANDKEKPADFYCMRLEQFERCKEVETMSHAMDEFYACRVRAEKFKQEKNNILRVVNSNIERCSKKVALQNKSVQQSADYENIMKTAELLKANLHNVREGMDKITVNDYYTEDYREVDIKLQENLTPQQNLQKLYKRYDKKKKTFHAAGEQLEESRQELEYIESVAALVNNAETFNDLREIKAELKEQGYIKLTREELKEKQAWERKCAAIIKKNGKYGKRSLPPKKDFSGKRSAEAPAEPKKYISADGFVILAGRNNKQNDRLTLKVAAKDDIWLHTQKIPGSHVIICTRGEEVPLSTIEEAANIAACTGKAKMSTKVPVDYTEIKNVWKAKGAKPGMVLYKNFKTVIVDPYEGNLKSVNDEEE